MPKKALLTRALDPSDIHIHTDLEVELGILKFEIHHWPLLRLSLNSAENRKLQQFLTDPPHLDWVLLTSPFAAMNFRVLVQTLPLEPLAKTKMFSNTHFALVGPKVQKRLLENNEQNFFPTKEKFYHLPSNASGASLWELLKPFPWRPEHNVLWITATEPQFDFQTAFKHLKNRPALHTYPIYSTVPDSKHQTDYAQYLESNPAWVCFTSPRAVQAFFQLNLSANQLKNCFYACLGTSTVTALEAHGHLAQAVPPFANLQKLAEAIKLANLKFD